MSRAGYLHNTVADLVTSFTVVELANEISVIYKAWAVEKQAYGTYDKKLVTDLKRVSADYKRIALKYKNITGRV